MILSKPSITDDRVYLEAKSLVDIGYNVTIIEWDRKDEYKSEETYHKIRLVRIHNTFGMKTMPNDLLRNPFWWRKAYKKAIELYKKDFKFDAVHCHDLDTIQTGVWLKQKFGCKLVYDAHEIFGYMIQGNVPKIAVTYAFSMEKKLVRYIDHLITINEPLEQYFTSITNTPISIVMNCKELLIKEYQIPENKIFTICYFGLLSHNTMFPEVIDVIGGIDKVKFLIASKKENTLYEEVQNQSKQYDNIEFLGTLPSTEILKKTLQSNVVLNMIDPKIILNRIGISNKVFEAMATGRPIISTKDTYRGDFIQRENAGLAIDYTPDALRKAIIHLRDNPQLCETLGKNGFHAAKKTYNWEAQKIKLLKIYEGFT